MPYATVTELPAGVKNNLPEHAQEIYLAAYNNALEEYQDPAKRRGRADVEDVARRVAWAAVKKEYEKDPGTGKWVRK